MRWTLPQARERAIRNAATYGGVWDVWQTRTRLYVAYRPAAGRPPLLHRTAVRVFSTEAPA